MNEQLQKEIEEKANRGPRVLPGDVENQIVSEQYYVFPGTTTTICCLTLRNGYTVVGDSACVFKENFNEEIGRKVSREKAQNKIWELLGYLLKEDMRRGVYGERFQHG